MRPSPVWLVPVLFALGAARVAAHPLAPALLDVTELPDGALAVVWTGARRAPPSAVVGHAVPAAR